MQVNNIQGLGSAAAPGRWATEQLVAAMAAGQPLSESVLRTCDTLRKDEWIELDDELVREGKLRLKAVDQLRSRGLVTPIANAFGKTVFQYEQVNDMEAAIVSLDGLARGDNDRHVFSQINTPIPIIHKDFHINLRTLSASRERGESLDVSQTADAGRRVAEKLEDLLINGGPTYGGNPIYGYRTLPNRTTGAHGTNGVWTDGSKTGTNMLDDVLTMKEGLQDDLFFGPYGLLLPGNYDVVVDSDFKANGDATIRDRILRINGVEDIQTCDQLADSEMILVNLSSDVVTMLDGVTLQTVQWDMSGGFRVDFKAFMIGGPLVKSTKGSRSGIYHMSGT